MRRLFAWTAGVVGIAALARLLARARRRPEPEAWTPPVDERAEALRRKLSETRATAEPPLSEQDAAVVATAASGAEEGVTAADPSSPDRPSESIEERRARVHAKAQEVIDAMQEALR